MNLALVRKRAILYLRISRDLRDGKGVERQEHEGNLVAERRNLDIVAVITDNDTSAKGYATRKGWNRMLKMLRDGEAEAIIGQDMTRVLRNGRDRVDMLEVGKEKKLTISLIMGSDLDLGTASGRVSADLLGALAQHEIEQKAERQQLEMNQRVREGREPSRRAFGYPGTDQRPGTTRKDQGGGLETRAIQVTAAVVAAEAEAVRQLFADALAGDSLIRLAQKLNAKGHATTRGGPWTRVSVRNLLLNPRYAGLRRYKDNDLVPGNWPALVSEETWRAVVDLVKDPARTTNHRKTVARLHLLGGLALCGVCNDGTTVRTSYGGQAKGAKSYRLYRCRNSGHIARRADYIDEYVEEVIIAWASSPEAGQYLIQKSGPDLAALRQDEATLTIRLDHLAEQFADGTLSPAQLRAGTTRLRTRLAEVQQDLKTSTSSATLGSLIGPDARGVWAGMNLDRRRRAISLVFTVTLMPRPADRPMSSRFDPDMVRVKRR